MNITCTWNDFQAIYPNRGMTVVFVKDANNDVPKVIVGVLEGTDKVFTITNPPSKNNFLAVYPTAIQVNSIT